MAEPSSFVHLGDGTTWPDPADPCEVEYRLRHGGATKGDLVVAAAFVAAYRELVQNRHMRHRNERIRDINDESWEKTREGASRA